ncbi:MAG: cytochrome P450, partial [Caulobacteraceae bacterium]
MQLISDTVAHDSRKGPAHAKRYADCPVPLWDPALFTDGPPLAAFAGMRQDAPVAWCDEPG